jgi:hypothetical protein
MKTHRLAFFLVAGVAAAVSAHAHEGAPAGKVVLVCPDRSPRMADIELAAKTAHFDVSQAVYRQMLERTRSVCAAGLSSVTLLAPANPLPAPDIALASDVSR